VIALVALAAAALYLTIVAVDRWTVLASGVLALAVVVVAAWYVVSRRGTARIVAAIVAIGALVAFGWAMLASGSVRVLVVGLLLAAMSVTAARFALHSDRHDPRAGPADPAHHPVLLINPRSGGGKAERFAGAERCRQTGIEPIVLRPGDDLLALAEDAVVRGADALGMAGGDGSQALVASVASRHGLPFVVVPAGTRNHFALDLGLDRDDVLGALDAFRDGFDHSVDLAEVNGRIFVNNAAMGAYAKIVQSADYRDAKVQTVATMLPDLIGPTATPLRLHYTLPTGEQHPAGQLLLISNNPYDLHHLQGGGTRARLDAGLLGGASITVSNAADAEALAVLEVAGRVGRFPGWQEWTATEIDVGSPDPVEIGVDGEALVLEPPLHFRSRPGALTVRLPRGALIRRAAARPIRVTESQTLAALWRMAFGLEAGGHEPGGHEPGQQKAVGQKKADPKEEGR
jgi:diacylglycerol kinase family enzyme